MADIQLIRGDDNDIALTVKDGDGNAIDITGYTIFFTVKANINDPDSAALIAKSQSSHTNAAAGLSTISISSTESNIAEGVYPFDFQLKTAAGKINSSQRGLCEVAKDVTIRTS